MIKLNASYSKKVPAETEYSSQQYHCQIEVELPDGLNTQQLQAKVHDVFDFVRNSVEAEIHNGTVPQMPPQQQMPQQVQPAPQSYPTQTQPVQQQYYDPQANYQQPQQTPQQYQPPAPQYLQNHGKQSRNANVAASPKQVNYLLSLAKRAGWTIQQILQRCQVQAVEQIPSKLCSQLIQEFSGAAA